MQLRPAKKYITTNGRISTRIKTADETLDDFMSISGQIGITRMAELTYLDKLFIPNFSAILPGTSDSIWVYSGKGLTKADARASALMEAVERYSALGSTYSGTIISGKHLQLSKSGNKILHPSEVIEPVYEEYEDNEDKTIVMDYVPAYDLISAGKVLVPAEIALYRYVPRRPAMRVFSHPHTNGLASGNTLEEAISHALCEVIERDAVSIADLCASSIHYTILNRVMEIVTRVGDYQFNTGFFESAFVDDSSIFPVVDINEIESESIKYLLRKFTEARIPVMVKDITQHDIGIPTFVASSVEWVTHDYGYFAKGYGAHPDAETALIRALTEVSQTRAANVQGARDDLKRIRYSENDEIYKRKWQFMPALSPSRRSKSFKEIIRFDQISSYLTKDIRDEIKLILDRLKKSGLKSAIVVDLTNPTIGVPVVRVLVPGLETFQITASIMGRRAKEYFKEQYT
jgi:thioglycine synthase